MFWVLDQSLFNSISSRGNCSVYILEVFGCCSLEDICQNIIYHASPDDTYMLSGYFQTHFPNSRLTKLNNKINILMSAIIKHFASFFFL